MTGRLLSAERLRDVLTSMDMSELDDAALAEGFAAERGLKEAAPDGRWARDPRSGSLVVYNPARAKRPHDRQTVTTPGAAAVEKPCPICNGNTTRVIDVRALSDGFTFINKNLFPCVYDPGDDIDRNTSITSVREGEMPPARGMHFLQWTSSLHDRDWHNMEVADLEIVLGRLAALEKKLLLEAKGRAPDTSMFNPGEKTFGFVSIIKNFGAEVGGSLTHGHQQVVHSNAMPSQIYFDRRFLLESGKSVADHLLESDASTLWIRDFGDAVLLVPPFMLRPYQMMLVFKNTKRRFLYELSEMELSAGAAGWAAAAHAVVALLPRLGRTPTYNVLVHNGPSGGLYVEILPFTQETGGYEHLGLYVCHETPENAAAVLRSALAIE